MSQKAGGWAGTAIVKYSHFGREVTQMYFAVDCDVQSSDDDG